MLNGLANARSGTVRTALALLHGHCRFLDASTGVTNDPRADLYALNPDGVLSNNRHFIADTQMEYQPNGDATTEGQSLQILGYCYAYLATRDPAMLTKARWHWDAYVDHFYAGQAIPETPQRWIANWLVNGKEPCLANWPINTVEPTQGGYKCVPLQFVNGVAQIPHGAPFWGEYLDVVTFAHRGHMAWPSIKGGVKTITDTVDWDAVYANHRVTTMPADPTDPLAWIDWPTYLGKPGYAVDWGSDEAVYPVNLMVAWTGNKIGVGPGPDDQLWSGDIVERGLPSSEFGKITLVDTSVNGVYLVNYAVRLPVEHGGYRFARNEVWHNRPIHTPLLGSVNQMGNAADGEEWFADACYLLWKITGQAKYKKALDASLFTNYEYTLIDAQDKFFRTSTSATTPFTDGISYSFAYPSNTVVEFGRSLEGHITVAADQAAQVSLEQQTIWFRLDQNSKIRTEYGGIGATGMPVTAKVELVLDTDKQPATEVKWGITLPAAPSPALAAYDVDLSHLTRMTRPDGGDYIVADSRAVTDYGALTWGVQFETGVLDGRSASIIKAVFADDSGGFIIGNWLQPGGEAPITRIVYRSNGATNLRIEDDDLWRWYWLLEDTQGAWVEKVLLPGDLILDGYQPSHPSDPAPAGPVYSQVDQLTVLLENSSDTNIEWSYYCVNDIPPRYMLEDGYTLKYRVTLVCGEAFDAVLGDCTVLDARDDALRYCPGVIPFSNIYKEGSDQLGAWHGMPYPGYQYPVIFALGGAEYDRHLNNMVDFLYDAQQFYLAEIGELGPVASAYIWNRWDNFAYGAPDTFTMYHWGDGVAWSGYQPRAFQGACRAWQELVELGRPVPPKLVTYCENWIAWLANFLDLSGGELPDHFPPDGPAEPGFTGHMVGLWLSGACLAALAGSTAPGIPAVIEGCIRELHANYVVTVKPGHPMNGSWSPAVRFTTGNGMFFGFWAGEILRGLGLYALYKQRGAGASIYPTVPVGSLGEAE